MKNFLKKISVLLLGLFTLVSCNAKMYITEFIFDDKEELKESLATATFIDDEGNSGIYFFSEEIKGELKPSKITYRLQTYTDRDGNKNMTKANLKLKRDAFRVSATLEFNDTNGKKDEEYVITATNDDHINALKDLSKYRISIGKSNKETYDEYNHDVAIGYRYTNEKGKDVYKRMCVVSSNLSYELIEEFCFKVLGQLEYIEIGK